MSIVKKVFGGEGFHPLSGGASYLAGLFLGNLLDSVVGALIVKIDPNISGTYSPSSASLIFQGLIAGSVEAVVAVALIGGMDKMGMSDENAALFMMGEMMSLHTADFIMGQITGSAYSKLLALEQKIQSKL